jgi:hypothetical protein
VRSKMMVVGLALVAAMVLACGATGDDTGGGGLNLSGDEKSIVFEVTGADGAEQADITFGVGASQSQENGSALPWSKELTDDSPLVIATVLAQNKGGGSISCKITIDGKVVKESTSTGEFAVVTCTND